MRKLIRVIRFLVKFSCRFQNQSFEFDFETLLPNSHIQIRIPIFRSEFSYSDSTSQLSFWTLIRIHNWSLFSEFEPCFPNFYLNSKLLFLVLIPFGVCSYEKNWKIISAKSWHDANFHQQKSSIHMRRKFPASVLSLKKYVPALLSRTQIYKITLCPRNTFS